MSPCDEGFPAFPLHRRTSIRSHTHFNKLQIRILYSLPVTIAVDITIDIIMSKPEKLVYPHFNTQTSQLRSVLILQLLPSLLTTGSNQRKKSYSQILKQLLFVFVIRGSPRFFLLNNPQIERRVASINVIVP
jgi:hypothetical protein